jgi:hypothetical protein
MLHWVTIDTAGPGISLAAKLVSLGVRQRATSYKRIPEALCWWKGWVTTSGMCRSGFKEGLEDRTWIGNQLEFMGLCRAAVPKLSFSVWGTPGRARQAHIILSHQAGEGHRVHF